MSNLNHPIEKDEDLSLDRVVDQIGYLLSSSYELIQNILRRLRYQDLSNATQVCKSWSVIGNGILQRERRLLFTFINFSPESLNSADSEVPGSPVPPSSFKELECFLAHPPPTLECCFGFVSSDWNFSKVLSKFSSNGMELPCLLTKAFPTCSNFALTQSFGIIGTSEKTSESSSDSGGGNLALEETPHLSQAPKDRADETLASCGASSFQFPHNFNNVGRTIELEEGVNDPGVEAPLGGLSLLLVPKQPGVKIKMFKLHETEFMKTRRQDQKPCKLSEEEFNRECELTPEEDLKAFLLFTDVLTPFNRSFIKVAQARQNDKVALGGGLIAQEDFASRLLAVAISGNNVQAASIVIPRTVKTPTEFTTRLQKLKDCGLPEEHSMCLMFSCCGRGSMWYKKCKEFSSTRPENVETKAFRKLFPVTPIFGFFLDGEFGNNYFGPEEAEDEEGCPPKRTKKFQSITHEYSSVFVFISFL